MDSAFAPDDNDLTFDCIQFLHLFLEARRIRSMISMRAMLVHFVTDDA